MTVFNIISREAEARYFHYRSESEEKCYVYFICDGEYVKIGVANNIKSRMADLQVGNARELFLVDYIECKNRQMANAYEYTLHGFFKDYRKNGEWFDVMGNNYFCRFIQSIPHIYESVYYELMRERKAINNPLLHYGETIRLWY